MPDHGGELLKRLNATKGTSDEPGTITLAIRSIGGEIRSVGLAKNKAFGLKKGLLHFRFQGKAGTWGRAMGIYVQCRYYLSMTLV